MITDFPSAQAALINMLHMIEAVALGIAGGAITIAALLFAIAYGWGYFQDIIDDRHAEEAALVGDEARDEARSMWISRHPEDEDDF